MGGHINLMKKDLFATLFETNYEVSVRLPISLLFVNLFFNKTVLQLVISLNSLML